MGRMLSTSLSASGGSKIGARELSIKAVGDSEKNLLRKMHRASLLLLLLLTLEAAEGFAGVQGFLSKLGAVRLKTVSHPTTSWKMSNTLVEAPRDPALVIGTPVPRLYVYDHCPFCVRVRFIMGVKNIKHNVVFLANDDIETPTKLVQVIHKTSAFSLEINRAHHALLLHSLCR
jgi:hypothetical protein